MDLQRAFRAASICGLEVIGLLFLVVEHSLSAVLLSCIVDEACQVFLAVAFKILSLNCDGGPHRAKDIGTDSVKVFIRDHLSRSHVSSRLTEVDWLVRASLIASTFLRVESGESVRAVIAHHLVLVLLAGSHHDLLCC